jgi:hypothetical protein
MEQGNVLKFAGNYACLFSSSFSGNDSILSLYHSAYHFLPIIDSHIVAPPGFWSMKLGFVPSVEPRFWKFRPPNLPSAVAEDCESIYVSFVIGKEIELIG